MKSAWSKLVVVSVVSGAIGFLALLGFSYALWHYYPYPEEPSEDLVKLVWAFHVMAEKMFGFIIIALCSLVSAIILRANWKHGFIAAIATGIVYQAVAIIVYITRFGFAAYAQHNQLLSTLGATLVISALFGYFGVWKSYRRTHKKSV